MSTAGGASGSESSEKIKSSSPNALLFLDELNVDVSGTILVMIRRMWDVSSIAGRYLSTDFVVSDSKGNVMRYTAKGTVAHTFMRVKEGGVYSIKNFTVQPNKEEYRVLKDSKFMLEFDGRTTIRKASVSTAGFLRFPFHLVDFDAIEPTNSKYLIDVAGFVTNVGRTIHQKSGSRTLDFYLANGRGISMRITLWGGLGDVLKEKKTKVSGMCPVVMASMTAKTYSNKLYLSSTSSTTIYDDESIPALQTLKSQGCGSDPSKPHIAVELSHPKDSTVENALIWARNRKHESSTFHCTVMIESVRTKKGWNYPSCGSGECRKGATRKYGKWFCEAWNQQVEYSVLRYRLELEVADETAHVVVVLFDEQTRELVKCSADSLAGSLDEYAEDVADVPIAITNLIGTTHTMEVKSHTYYEFGTFESFTCSKIVANSGMAEHAESQDGEEKPEKEANGMKNVGYAPCVSTPSKGPEKKKKKRAELDDSDADVESGSSSKIVVVLPDEVVDTKKKNFYPIQ